MLLYHLKELKLRLFYIFLAYVLTFIVLYLNCEELLIYLSNSLISLNIINHFIYTNITEAFFTYLNLVVFMSFIVTLPILSIHIWLYAISGLYVYERKYLRTNLLIIVCILMLGLERSIHFLIPFTYKFFIQFSEDLIVLEPKINEYVKFMIHSILSFVLVITFPLIIYMIKLPINTLIKLRKYVMLGIICIIGLITPPSIFSQLMISIPFIISYELIIYVRIYKEKCYHLFI